MNTNLEKGKIMKNVKRLCKKGNSSEIYEFIDNNKDLEPILLDKLVKRMCELNDLEYILKLLKIMTLSNNNVVTLVNKLISSKNIEHIKRLIMISRGIISYNYIVNLICYEDDVKLIYEFLLFSKDFIGKENISNLVLKICKLKDIRYILVTGKYIDKLSNDDTSNLADVLIELDKILELVEFVEETLTLSKEKIDEIINLVIKSKYIPAMYRLAKVYYDRFGEKNNLLITEILKSKGIKYICLIAVYIDNSLIFKLFKDTNSLYQFMEYSGYYSDNEIRFVRRKIYGENYQKQDVEIQEKHILEFVNNYLET